MFQTALLLPLIEKSLSQVFWDFGTMTLLRMDIFTTHGPPSSKQASADIERSRTFPSIRSFTTYLVKTFLITNNFTRYTKYSNHKKYFFTSKLSLTNMPCHLWQVGSFLKSSLWNQLWQEINKNYMPLTYEFVPRFL